MSDSSYTYLDLTGVIVPDTSDLLTTVQGEFQTALGNDLSLDPQTPQGRMIEAETLARSQSVINSAQNANQLNPNLAGGVFLDSICALTGIQRIAATRSTVLATLNGQPGGIIPEGVRAQTPTGDIFESTAGVVLGSDGTAQVLFESQEYGAIAALAGDLNQIVDGVLSWEGITNAQSAALGTAEETDQALRARRKETLAKNGVALAIAQTSALYEVEGVTSLQYRENYTNAAQTIGGVTLAPHSVYACVAGGLNSDVAAALLANKSGGAAWNGGTSVTIIEAASGQPYTVLFDRPTLVPLQVRATVKIYDALVDPATATRQAIVDYAAGLLDGEAGLTVGAAVSPFELGGAVNREYPGIYIQKIEVATLGGTYAVAEIPLNINQQATISASNIVVNVVT